MSKRELPGINIQWPWSELLLSGKKTIETRSYPIPEKFKNVEMAIIETPGPNGKKNGIMEARIVGTITFSNSTEYKTKVQWLKDQDKHLVTPDDKQFSFRSDKAKWGWIVKDIRRFDLPKSPPKKRGIVFAKSCKI
jgi:hypothetical protein